MLGRRSGRVAICLCKLHGTCGCTWGWPGPSRRRQTLQGRSCSRRSTPVSRSWHRWLWEGPSRPPSWARRCYGEIAPTPPDRSPYAGCTEPHSVTWSWGPGHTRGHIAWLPRWRRRRNLAASPRHGPPGLHGWPSGPWPEIEASTIVASGCGSCSGPP